MGTSVSKNLYLCSLFASVLGAILLVTELHAASSDPGHDPFPFLVVIHLLLACVQVVPTLGFVLLHPRLRDSVDGRTVHLIFAVPCLLIGVVGFALRVLG